MNFQYGQSSDNVIVLSMLKERKTLDPNFSVIDVGASANPWTSEVLDATFDLNDIADDPVLKVKHFFGNINKVEDWQPLLDHVSAHGKFSFSICTHTLEDVAYPIVALDMLPRISKMGFVSMPSHHREFTRAIEGPWRGYIHHRWIFKVENDVLILVPKIPFLEHSSTVVKPCLDERSELQVHWEGSLPYAIFNGDYLGPNVKTVTDLYESLLNIECDA